MSKIDILDKKAHLSLLFDFYEALLTQKQREYFRYYYFEDLSLAEIANIYGVTRNAIHDLLQKTFALLEGYEKKLGLYNRFTKRQQIFKQYQDSENQEVLDLIKKLKEIE